MLEQPLRFGPELRRVRLQAGLSLGQLSQRVHYSKAQLSKVERDLKPPSKDLARLCDGALGADGALFALLPSTPAPDGLPAPDTAKEGEEVWLMHLSANGPSWFQAMGRRQVMAAGAASVVALGTAGPAGGAAFQDDSGGASLLETSRSLFDHYRRLGQASSPEVVLPALIAQTHSLRELSARTGPRTRNGLLRLASRYAEYVGWLVEETGDDEAALWWTDRAVDLASAGGDTELAAYSLVRRALVTFYRDDAQPTIALSQQAQRDARSGRIRGLAAQQEAQGHALGGDHRACMRSLERARVLLDGDEPHASAPVIGTTTLPDPVAMITGWCLHDLGRPKEAAEALDREIARMPEYALSARTRYGARRALAYAAAGEVEHACELTRELLAAAGTLSSATIRTDLRRLARTLARHPGAPAVRKLSPDLSSYLTAARPGPAR